MSMEGQFNFTIIILSYLFELDICCGGYKGSGWVIPLRIQSSNMVIFFHWIDFCVVIFDLEMSIWRSKVSSF
jgi:hypothetical protein